MHKLIHFLIVGTYFYIIVNQRNTHEIKVNMYETMIQAIKPIHRRISIVWCHHFDVCSDV